MTGLEYLIVGIVVSLVLFYGALVRWMRVNWLRAQYTKNYKYWLENAGNDYDEAQKARKVATR